MDIEKIKEELSICYLRTISAINGIDFELMEHDDDSVDVMLKKIIKFDDTNRINSQITVQLKSTSSKSQYAINKDDITYHLKVKNYNDLCAPSIAPIILALLILPEEKNEWIKWSEEELLLKGQMYWVSLRNNEPSDNSSSVSVKIPKVNILSDKTIDELLKKVAEELIT